MRSSLLEVIQMEYIQVARAKGLRERAILYRHAIRNALIPMVTLFANTFPILLERVGYRRDCVFVSRHGQIALRFCSRQRLFGLDGNLNVPRGHRGLVQSARRYFLWHPLPPRPLRMSRR